MFTLDCVELFHFARRFHSERTFTAFEKINTVLFVLYNLLLIAFYSMIMFYTIKIVAFDILI